MLINLLKKGDRLLRYFFRIGVGFFILSVVVIGLTAYYGGFHDIKIDKKMTGPYVFVYEPYQGDYTIAGDVFEKVCSELENDFSVKTWRGAGIYFYDPEKVDVENLRSEIGCLLEGDDLNKIEKIKKRYQVKNIPLELSIIASFPYTNTFSVAFGAMRVYPELKRYIKEYNIKQGPVMEIYDIRNEKIEYILKKD